ncbi:MAG: rod-determining factor RdfA [Methanobacterium sp.]
MVCAIDTTIESLGLDAAQINEEIKSMYLGLGYYKKRYGAPAIAHHVNTEILEGIIRRKAKEKNVSIPLVKMSDLYKTVRKIFESKEVSEEDYNITTAVLQQYDIDMYALRDLFISRAVMWNHIKHCLNLPIKKVSTEEFLKKADTRVKYLKDNFGLLLKQASIRGIGGEGTSLSPFLVVRCDKCGRLYDVEEVLRKDFICKCTKERA